MTKKVKPAQASSPFKGGVFEFIGGVKSELQKINWTAKDELHTYTKAVVIATFACGFGIYFTDLLIQGVLSLISMTLGLIGG